MSIRIMGIGTAVPEYSVTQERALAHARSLICSTERQERVIAELYKRTEINTRSSVLAGEVYDHQAPFFNVSDSGGPSTAERMRRYQLEAPALAVVAAARALESSAVLPEQITHLVTVSCTGFAAPGFDIALIKRLCLPPGVTRTNVGFMGCHGLINALKLAKDMAAANSCARVLVCAAELCSLHFQYSWCSDNLVANSLFSDGAGALVVAANEGQWVIESTGSYVVPESEDAMTWRIGDNGFLMSLSAQVPEHICRHLPPWLEGWLTAQSRKLTDIRGWAVHPGGPRILDAVESCLALSTEALCASREVLACYGNMSSPTVLFVFQKLLAHRENFPCLFLGFGPGLSMEALMVVKNE